MRRLGMIGLSVGGLFIDRFGLFRANLSEQWLVKEDLREANLGLANLRGSHLNFTNLIGPT